MPGNCSRVGIRRSHGNESASSSRRSAALSVRSRSATSTTSRVCAGADATALAAGAELEAPLQTLGDPGGRAGAEAWSRTRSRAPRAPARSAATRWVVVPSTVASSASVPPALTAAATASPSGYAATARRQQPWGTGRSGQREGAAQVGQRGAGQRGGQPSTGVHPVAQAGDRPGRLPRDDRLQHLAVRVVGQHLLGAGRTPAVERVAADPQGGLHRAAGVLPGQLAELPLPGQPPQRVVHRRGEALPGVALAGDRLDAVERVDPAHGCPLAR